LLAGEEFGDDWEAGFGRSEGGGSRGEERGERRDWVRCTEGRVER
jgi:hypothetical protein